VQPADADSYKTKVIGESCRCLSLLRLRHVGVLRCAVVAGNYENRLRQHSNPEKVFQYFASVERDGEWFMTPADFLRAITPYNAAVDSADAVGTRNSKYAFVVKSAKVRNVARVARGSCGTWLVWHVARGSCGCVRRVPHCTKRRCDVRLTLASVSVFVSGGRQDTSEDATSSMFAKLLDHDGDGLLSYGEYIFFLTLLASK
jgi:hypothetical protein